MMILSIFPIKVDLLILKILKQSEENSRDSIEFPNQNLKQIGLGALEL